MDPGHDSYDGYGVPPAAAYLMYQLGLNSTTFLKKL